MKSSIMGRPVVDLTGQRFGSLVALHKCPKPDKRRAYWICRCDCGAETRTRSDSLRNGGSTSCTSCGRVRQRTAMLAAARQTREDISGQHFGLLTTIRSVGFGKWRVKWLCECACGRQCEVEAKHLKAGTQVSCGCYGKIEAITHGTSHTNGYRQAKSAKRRALKRGAGGSYTDAQMQELFRAQGGCCKYCAQPLTYDQIHRDHRLPIVLGGSSDMSNMQILCAACNLSKGRRHPDEYEAGLRWRK